MFQLVTVSDSHGIEALVDAAEVVVGLAELGCALLVVGTPERRGQVGQVDVVAVLGDGGFDEQVDARGILVAVDGVEVTGGAHDKLSGAVLENHIVHQGVHVLVDIAHIVGNVLIGQQPVGVGVQYFLDFVVHSINNVVRLQTAKIVLFFYLYSIRVEKCSWPSKKSDFGFYKTKKL